MAVLAPTDLPDSADDTAVRADGVNLEAVETRPGQWDWAVSSTQQAANDEHPIESISVSGGDTVNPTKMHTYVVLDTDTADDWADGTVNTDPQDATSIILGAPTVDNQRVYVKRTGQFVGVVNATIEGGATGAEAHADNRTMEFIGNLGTGEWKDITEPADSGGGGTNPGTVDVLGKDFVATVGQGNFALDSTPTDPESVQFLLSGGPVMLMGHDFTVAAATVTLTGANAALIQAGDNIRITYF